MAPASSPTIVLVHGAWHGAWCWDRVVPLLRDAGLAARAVALPSTGAGSTAGLADDVATVTRVLDEESEVVLVGHSYGGAVVTDAGAHPAVRRLVYLAAFPLAEGESCAAAAPEEAAAVSHEGRPEFRITDHGDGTMSPANPAETLFEDCDDAVAGWAIERLRPQHMAALADEPSRIAWRDKPGVYAVCALDNAVHPELQRILARRCTSAVEWPTSHSPFLSRPDLVVDLLLAETG